jgi:hypothetical protein
MAMKTLFIFLISICCFSFCPSTEVAINVTSNGFYVSVKDLTDRTYHEYIVETKDSVKMIFNKYFQTELALGEVDYPISIYNGKRDFYIARVYVYEKSNGKKDFKHLNYPNVYDKNSKANKRSPVPPAIFK